MNDKYIRKVHQQLFLTDVGEEHLREVFPTNINEDICNEFDIALSVLNRFRKQLGLKKDKEFLRKKSKEGGDNWASKLDSLPDEERERYIEIRKKVGRESENKFKKGYDPKAIGEEAFKAKVAKIVENRLATRKKDKARIAFGLEPKSRMYFKPKMSEQIYYKLKILRRRMRTIYNYECEKFKLSAKITDNTKRNFYLETRLISLGGSVVDTRTNKQ